MAGFEVIISEIRERGENAKTVGEEAGQVTLGGTVEELPAAVAGGVAAKQAEALAEAWGRRIQELRDKAVEHGESMVAAAAEYERSDEAARRNLELPPDGDMRPV